LVDGALPNVGKARAGIVAGLAAAGGEE